MNHLRAVTQVDNIGKIYGRKVLNNRRIKAFFRIDRMKPLKKATQKEGLYSVIVHYERRVDIALFRSGLFESIAESRKWIRSGCITVNNEPLGNFPSRQLELGDFVRIHPNKSFTPIEQKQGKKGRYYQQDKFHRHILYRAKKRMKCSSRKRMILRPVYHLEVSFTALSIVFAEMPNPHLLSYPFRFMTMK